MKIHKFGLGVRFSILEGEVTQNQLWEEVFSVLTTSELKGMYIYGGMVASSTYALEDPCYMCVFTNGSLKDLRRIFQKLEADEGINMYLTPNKPFLQSNALEKIDGLTFYGKVQGDGTIANGEAVLEATVCKKRGKRRPLGKGIVFMLAPDAYTGGLTSKLAIRRLTLSARKTFRGVRVLPLPMANGGAGTVDALLMASNGIGRTAEISGPNGGMVPAHYAVLKGSTALIEMPDAYALGNAPEGGSSFGIGEIIRRVLDEGLHEIIIGCGESCINDMGLGCLRALGVKLLDREDNELKGAPGDMRNIEKIDLEFLHARLSRVKFTCMTNCTLPLIGEDGGIAGEGPCKQEDHQQGMLHVIGLLEEQHQLSFAHQPGSGEAGGLGMMLMAFMQASFKSNVDTLLDAIEFDKRIRHVSLVVTGAAKIDADALDEGRVVGAIANRCARQKTPLAMIAGTIDAQVQEELSRCGMISMTTGEGMEMREEEWIGLFDRTADRMFRFIRLGREIERVSARKNKAT